MEKAYTIMNGNVVWHPPYRFPDPEQSYRPKCINHGCNSPVAVLRGTNGVFKGREIRTVCSHCHQASYGKKKLKDGVTAFKKDYCENRNGKLGFVCTSTIHSSANLELDHIDGNHFNNIEKNVQTLCQICHTEKSKRNGDFKRSPAEQRAMGLPPPSVSLLSPCSEPSTKNHPNLQSTSLCIEANGQLRILGLSEIQPICPSD
jgi:5-methylcytosine-specific restriction endonuclease McrA